MPTYDYECARCGEMEIFQSITADPLARCPECGSKRFRRLIGCGAGVIFKGDGFYETDYKRGKDYGEKAAAADKPKSSEGGKAGEKAGTGATADKGSANKPAKTTD